MILGHQADMFQTKKVGSLYSHILKGTNGNLENDFFWQEAVASQETEVGEIHSAHSGKQQPLPSSPFSEGAGDNLH